MTNEYRFKEEILKKDFTYNYSWFFYLEKSTGIFTCENCFGIFDVGESYKKVWIQNSYREDIFKRVDFTNNIAKLIQIETVDLCHTCSKKQKYD